MKTLFKNLSFMTAIVIALYSCKPEKERTVIPQSNLESFFKNNEVETQSFTINCAKENVIKGKLNTQFYIPPNTFRTKDNKAVSGDITIELKEISNKSDMILSNRPTTSNGQILISAGEFYINAKQNNQDLQLNGNSSITVKTPTQNIVKDMTVFVGQNSSNGFNWVTSSSLGDSVIMGTNTNTTPYTYVYTISRLGWINCDAFYNSSDPKTNVTIDIGNKSPNDTRIYLVFKDMNSVMATYFTNNSKFTSIGLIPLGKRIEVVAISGSDSKYYLAHQEIEVANDQTVNLQFEEKSDEEIKTFCSTLN